MLPPRPPPRRFVVRSEPAASLARWEARRSSRRPPAPGALGRVVGAWRAAEAGLEQVVRGLCGRSLLAVGAAPGDPLFASGAQRWLARYQLLGVAWMLCTAGAVGSGANAAG